MTLSQLFQQAGVVPDALFGDAELAAMVQDSRKVIPGALFVAYPGHHADSHSFLEGAKEAGAAAALVHSQEGLERAAALGLPRALVTHEGLKFNEAIWRLAKAFFGNPTASMKVVGVTGTNGKTTTAWLVRDMLAALGVKAGYLGTLGFQIPGEERELANTTPFSIELNTLLAEARDKGVEAMAIEVSSHALAERRADGVEFDVVAFTNLTQDHLDFHGSMEEYAAAKVRLFSELPKQTSKPTRVAINSDDAAAHLFASAARPVLEDGQLDRMVEFGRTAATGLRPEQVEVAVDHISMRLRHGDQSTCVEVPLGGSYNVENTLAASAAVLALGCGLDSLQQALPRVRPVPGRFEPVRNEAGIGILVDYAHTPDAVEKLLDAVRPLTKGRVITVFGCGGDRDKTKRPLMAKAASERSDLTVITSDNPRTEDPQSIIDDIVPGIAPGRESAQIIDRPEAIAYAVRQAKPGDVVVIAGKGHENYQIIGRTKYPMDDRELAREALK